MKTFQLSLCAKLDVLNTPNSRKVTSYWVQTGPKYPTFVAVACASAQSDYCTIFVVSTFESHHWVKNSQNQIKRINCISKYQLIPHFWPNQPDITHFLGNEIVPELSSASFSAIYCHQLSFHAIWDKKKQPHSRKLTKISSLGQNCPWMAHFRAIKISFSTSTTTNYYIS